jgi:hypothetical protein
VFNALNRTIETTEKLAQELRVKCKHIIAQKSKTSVYKEDMAGILNRYGEVYQEINDYYCNEPPEIKECDPFQVFLVNQNHLSNCFLLLSDHLNDNVRKFLFYLILIF